MARLVILSEGMTGISHELKVEKTTVGRVEDNAFQIAEPSVSSHHAEIWLRGNDVVVKDLNSTNGTFVGGQQITDEAVLKPGQIFRFGNVQIRLESGKPAAPVKKALDQTMVIQQGVKLNDLEGGTKVVNLDTTSHFGKKRNKTAIVFIAIAIILATAIILGLIYVFNLSNTINRQ
jgi:pSer/pThr/pTyr-binding forkhead associated (FHA) protein